MRLHASKLDLPLPTSSFPSPYPSSPAAAVSSLLFEPSSHSLALMLVDSSALLYPSLSPGPSHSPSPTAVPPPSTAACFLRLLPSNRVVFLSASPLAAGSAVQLRSWILAPRCGGASSTFAPARLDYRNERDQPAVTLGFRHGHTVRLVGSVNAFVIHSSAANQIWVMAARPASAEKGTVHLVKCAVIELTLPIYSITLSTRSMLLGEVDGVRVFPLWPLLKGRISKSRDVGHRKASASMEDICNKNLPNGLVIPKTSLVPESGSRCDCSGSGQEAEAEGKTDGCSAPHKLKIVRIRQDSGDLYSFFVVIKRPESQNYKVQAGVPTSSKAVCIHVLSQKKYLILDSTGDLHVLKLKDSGMSLEPTSQFSMFSEDAHLYHLDNVMEVQLLATLPDTSSKTQFVWLSDGGYSIHLISLDDTETTVGEGDNDENKQKASIFSVVGAIFTSEKIQDIVPISTNSCLVLCQGNMFIYGIA
ncbi:hypothetical protein Cni_G11868 [Canna indica]|uniref:Uncharacterized protein n=1 Tax=Canna indica TaxID=4628 RepID=A0AAQ3QBL5_9LILI|nr:hypothetical protein Cni_G11868 [Canna indica]